MSTGLFRTEAIDQQRRRLWGEVVVVVPVRHTVLTGLLCAVAFTAAGFLWAGSYARTETVLGFVTAVGGQAQVYATRGGTIVGVFVHEGDFVAKDHPLAEVNLETETLGGPISARLRAESVRRIAELDAQIQSADSRFEGEGKRLRFKQDGLKAELESLTLRVAAERQLLLLQKADLQRYEQLASSGYAPQIELSRRKQQALAQEGTVRELERQRRSRETDLSEVDTQLETLPLERADRLSQLRNSRSELLQAVTQLEANQGYTILAPIAGQVAALQADVGQSLSKATPIAAIAPTGSATEVQLLVPTRASGFVSIGQDVVLRIDAYPFQRFGTVGGRITQISKAVFKPGEILVPIPHQEAAYRVVVAIDDQKVDAYGESRSLVPGMTLVADIVTDHRRFIDWILDPLRAASKRAQ